MDEDDLDFNERLRRLHYEVTVIDEGVDNLYQAIATFLYGSDAKHLQVEAEIRHFFNANTPLFYDVDSRGVHREKISIRYWLPGGGWALNSRLVAASILYEMVVVVINHNSNTHFQYPEEGGYDKIMTVSHDEEGHLNLLTMVPSQAPDEQN